MPVLPIRLFPDPDLRTPTLPVENFGDALLLETISQMDRTMREQLSGIGIAAPQVGILKKIAIVDVSSRDRNASLMVLINPVIVEMREERASREGCMSLPDYMANLKRYNWVRVKWQDEFGNYHEKTTSGIEAVCIQHEVDHLNGILFLDRVTSLKRDMMPRQSKP